MPVTLDLTKTIPIYQNAMTQLIDQMGKRIILVSKTKNPNYSPATEDKNKPAWSQGSSTEPQEIEVTEDIKGLVGYSAPDARTYNINVDEYKNLLQIKTFITLTDKLKSADHIIPSADSQSYFHSKYRLVRGPFPLGLGEDFLVLTFWSQI
jgi:hypothetical protein